jgi:hypothetical protein
MRLAKVRPGWEEGVVAEVPTTALHYLPDLP